MNKAFGWGLGLVLAALFFIWWEWPATNLRIVNCDVGQGDAFLITQGFNQVLIDGGNPGGGVVNCLGQELPFWDRKLELVVATHPDRDHIGGLTQVFGGYRVSTFLAPDLGANSEIFAGLRKAVARENTKLVLARGGQRIAIGEMALKIIWPNKWFDEGGAWQQDLNTKDQNISTAVVSIPEEQSSTDSNGASVVILLGYNAFEALFLGDAPVAVEDWLVAAGQIPEVEYLKIGHHGSKTSTGEAILATSSPEVVAMGVGRNNRYGHPHKDVISQLDAIKVQVLRTDIDGTVAIETDGKRWWRE